MIDPKIAIGGDHSSQVARSWRVSRLDSRVGASMATLATIATFGLSLAASSRPMIPIAVAAAFLVAVMLIRNLRWVVHGLLIVAFTTLPAGKPIGIRVGGYYIFYYELFIVATLIYSLALLRSYPRIAQRLSRSGPIGIAALFSVACGSGLILALIHDFPFRDIQIDARPVVSMMMVAFAAAIIFATGEWRHYIKTVLIILWTSAVYTLYSSLAGQPVGLRTEVAQLTAGGTGLTESGSSAGALRYLTQTTPLALGTSLAIITLLTLGRMTTKTALPALIPALVIIFLAFSRNAFLALAASFIFTLLVAMRDRGARQLFWRVSAATIVLWIVGAGGLVTARVLGASNWVDVQIAGFGDRVITGFEQTANDDSARFRLREDNYLKAEGAKHPILGGGFGDRYKSASTDSDFEKDVAQLYAHNFYLWAYVKIGLFGVFTFVALLVGCVAPALRRLRGNPISIAAASTLVGVAAAIFVSPMPIDHGINVLPGLVIGACLGVGVTGVDRVSAQPR